MKKILRKVNKELNKFEKKLDKAVSESAGLEKGHISDVFKSSTEKHKLVFNQIKGKATASSPYEIVVAPPPSVIHSVTTGSANPHSSDSIKCVAAPGMVALAEAAGGVGPVPLNLLSADSSPVLSVGALKVAESSAIAQDAYVSSASSKSAPVTVSKIVTEDPLLVILKTKSPQVIANEDSGLSTSIFFDPTAEIVGILEVVGEMSSDVLAENLS